MRQTGLRALGFGLVLALAGMAFAPGWAAAGNAPLQPFRVGIVAPVVTTLPIWMADAAGFFAREGLEVEVVDVGSGARGLEEVRSGALQAVHVGLVPVVLADRKGADFRIVASSCNTIPMTMFARPGLRLAELQGKGFAGRTFAISSAGSETDMAVRVLLNRHGLTARDVTIAEDGGTEQRLAALIGGRADVAPLTEPAITAAREHGLAVVSDLAAEKTPWIFAAVAVRESLIRQDRPRLTRFLRAYLAGAYLALADGKQAKAVIARRLGAGDAKAVEATYADFRRLMPLDAAPSLEGARNVLAQLAAIGRATGGKAEDYVDPSLIDGLRRSGYIAELARAYPSR